MIIAWIIVVLVCLAIAIPLSYNFGWTAGYEQMLHEFEEAENKYGDS